MEAGKTIPQTRLITISPKPIDQICLKRAPESRLDRLPDARNIADFFISNDHRLHCTMNPSVRDRSHAELGHRSQAQLSEILRDRSEIRPFMFRKGRKIHGTGD